MHAPLRPSFQVEWRRLAALEPIASEWRALAARAIEPNVFYEPAFALAAAPVFGADAGAVLVRTAGGRLAGLFPARMPAGAAASFDGGRLDPSVRRRSARRWSIATSRRP